MSNPFENMMKEPQLGEMPVAPDAKKVDAKANKVASDTEEDVLSVVEQSI